jgi:glycosyltransferase involved in cell wall biosynthesis
METQLPEALASYVKHAEVRSAHLEMRSTPTRAEARRLLGIDPEARVAVLVARLVKGKRVSVGLRAADLVPDLRSYVIGSGPLKESLMRDFPRATFLGQLPRSGTLLWISAADLLISASRKEGAPTVVREARLLLTPVVSVDAGDLATWAKDDEQLYLVKSRSIT